MFFGGRTFQLQGRPFPSLFFFLACSFGVMAKKPLANPVSQSFFLFSSKTSIIFLLRLPSLICPQVPLLYVWKMKGSPFLPHPHKLISALRRDMTGTYSRPHYKQKRDAKLGSAASRLLTSEQPQWPLPFPQLPPLWPTLPQPLPSFPRHNEFDKKLSR